MRGMTMTVALLCGVCLLGTGCSLIDTGKAMAAKYEALEENQVAQNQRLEAMVGAVDIDGDGEVTRGEVGQAVARVGAAAAAGDKDALDMLKDPAWLGAMALLLTGLGIGKKGLGAGIKKLHLAGRARANGDSTGGAS